MNDKKLLSIVIPTRNREYYCIEAIKSILRFQEDCFELVVQDNSDSNEVQEFVSSLNDNRLIYNQTIGRINFVVNIDKALSLATGEYVIMIGDDDTVSQRIFELVQWAKDNNIEAVTPKRQVQYYWPDSLQLDNNGVVYISSKYTYKYNSYNGENQVIEMLKGGIINYSGYNLPKVYHGIMKRTILDEIKNRTGRFIGGLSPDIYLAVAAALLCEKYYVVDFSFTIAGACPQSATAESLRGGHRGDLNTAPHLYNRADYEWDKLIPKLYTVETIWAESALTALRDMNNAELCRFFNSGYFFAGLLWHNLSMRTYILRKIKETSLGNNKRMHTLISFFYFVTKSIAIRFIRFFLPNNVKKISNVSDISNAYDVSESYLKTFLNKKI